jgi:hypothetical protein
MNGPPNDERPAPSSSRDADASPSNINLTPGKLPEIVASVNTVTSEIAVIVSVADQPAILGLDDGKTKQARPLAQLSFFRAAEHPKDPRTFLVTLPAYGPDDDAHVVHAVLCEDSLDPSPAYAVMRALWPRRLLPPNCHFLAVCAHGLLIGMDACAETVAEHAAHVARLAWSFPVRVGVVRMDPQDVALAERLGCGVHYTDDPVAS